MFLQRRQWLQWRQLHVHAATLHLLRRGERLCLCYLRVLFRRLLHFSMHLLGCRERLLLFGHVWLQRQLHHCSVPLPMRH